MALHLRAGLVELKLWQKWTGTYLQDMSLHALRHRVHLGHNRESCPNPRSIMDGFTVVDLSGIHAVGLVFCGCVGAAKNNVQLLRVQWFPATTKDPHSAYTFDILNTFHILNLQEKLLLHDFYQSIHRKCDNVGIRELKVRKQFLPTITFLLPISRIDTSRCCQLCISGGISKW